MTTTDFDPSMPVRPDWADPDQTRWSDDGVLTYQSAPVTVDCGEAVVTLQAAWTPQDGDSPAERGIFIDLIAGSRMDLDGTERLGSDLAHLRDLLKSTN